MGAKSFERPYDSRTVAGKKSHTRIPDTSRSETVRSFGSQMGVTPVPKRLSRSLAFRSFFTTLPSLRMRA